MSDKITPWKLYWRFKEKWSEEHNWESPTPEQTFVHQQSIIDAKDAEIEKLRMQLAACGVVAMANTRESAEQVRQMHPDYMCASVQDVMRCVDKQIEHREHIQTLTKERDDLIKRFEGCVPVPVEFIDKHNGQFIHKSDLMKLLPEDIRST